MRICYIGDAGSIHLARWAQFFAERGHRIHVVTDTRAELGGCQVHRVPDYSIPWSVPLLPALQVLLRKALAVRRLVKKVQPDLVHGHYATNYGFLAALGGFRPLVQTVHGSDLMIDLDGRIENRLFIRYALRRADLVTSVAQHITRRIRRLGVSPQRITTFQYGVDTEVFTPPDAQSRRNPTRVVSTRHLEWRYNLQLLVKAIPCVLDAVPDASFVLVGDGPDRARLTHMACDLGITDPVAFPGHIGQAAVAQHLQGASVYVSTSLTDGASLSLLEAMACGAFPVVTDIPANREWITHGANGLLVPADNPEALAFAILRALKDRDLCQAAAKQNVSVVQGRASYRHNMARMERLYQQLVG